MFSQEAVIKCTLFSVTTGGIPITDELQIPVFTI